MKASAIFVLACAALTLLGGPAFAGTIYAPVATQLFDVGANADRWWLTADDGGTITVDVFSEIGGTISFNGGAAQNIAAGASTISISAAAGSENYVEFAGGLWNYRPTFHGVSQAYILEDQGSPNDLVNFGDNTFYPGSNISLGYNGPDSNFPVPPAKTQWFYDLDLDDIFSWTGFFDDLPYGDDAASIEFFDPLGVSQGLFTGAPLLDQPGGFTFTDIVQTGQEGFWSVLITSPLQFITQPGHYLMDVTVNNDPNSDASNRHYLMPLAPPIPEPATLALLGMGLGAAVLRRSKKPNAGRADPAPPA